MDHENSHPHFHPEHLRSTIEPAHRGRAQRLIELAERTGIVHALRCVHDKRNPVLTVLAYHRVMPIDALSTYPFDEELISATPAQFDWQMRHLRENLHPVSLTDVIAHLDNGRPLPASAVAVTFDDGFTDTHRYAFPILKRYQIPATIFVSTGYVDSQQPFWFELTAYLMHRVPLRTLELPNGRLLPSSDERDVRTADLRLAHRTLKDLPNVQRSALIDSWNRRFRRIINHDTLQHSQPISWQQIREMNAAGLDFGSHTVTHPNLTQLSDAELSWELQESKQVLESRLQHEVTSLAYPIGTTSAFDDRVTIATQRHGFKLGVTYVSGANPIGKINRLEIHRHGIGLSMTPRYFRALTALPAWLN